MLLAVPVSYAQANIPDKVIYRSLKHNIESAPELNRSRVTVSVKDGLVGARGVVDSLTAHDKLVALVKKTPGVIYFVDTVSVAGQSAKSREAIRQNVYAALKSDPKIGFLEFGIQMEGNQCHLTGGVVHSSQARRAVRIAKRVDGVRTVTNSVRIMR